QPRDADRLASLVLDADVPDLGGAADVHGAGGAGDGAGTGRAQVVGVDLQPDADVGGGVHAQVAGAAAEGFGQHHRGAAVQQAVGLAGARVHRHGGLQPVVA